MHVHMVFLSRITTVFRNFSYITKYGATYVLWSDSQVIVFVQATLKRLYERKSRIFVDDIKNVSRLVSTHKFNFLLPEVMRLILLFHVFSTEICAFIVPGLA